MQASAILNISSPWTTTELDVADHQAVNDDGDPKRMIWGPDQESVSKRAKEGSCPSQGSVGNGDHGVGGGQTWDLAGHIEIGTDRDSGGTGGGICKGGCESDEGTLGISDYDYYVNFLCGKAHSDGHDGDDETHSSWSNRERIAGYDDHLSLESGDEDKSSGGVCLPHDYWPDHAPTLEQYRLLQHQGQLQSQARASWGQVGSVMRPKGCGDGQETGIGTTQHTGQASVGLGVPTSMNTSTDENRSVESTNTQMAVSPQRNLGHATEQYDQTTMHGERPVPPTNPPFTIPQAGLPVPNPPPQYNTAPYHVSPPSVPPGFHYTYAHQLSSYPADPYRTTYGPAHRRDGELPSMFSTHSAVGSHFNPSSLPAAWPGTWQPMAISNNGYTLHRAIPPGFREIAYSRENARNYPIRGGGLEHPPTPPNTPSGRGRPFPTNDTQSLMEGSGNSNHYAQVPSFLRRLHYATEPRNPYFYIRSEAVPPPLILAINKYYSNSDLVNAILTEGHTSWETKPRPNWTPSEWLLRSVGSAPTTGTIMASCPGVIARTPGDTRITSKPGPAPRNVVPSSKLAVSPSTRDLLVRSFTSFNPDPTLWTSSTSEPMSTWNWRVLPPPVPVHHSNISTAVAMANANTSSSLYGELLVGSQAIATFPCRPPRQLTIYSPGLTGFEEGPTLTRLPGLMTLGQRLAAAANQVRNITQEPTGPKRVAH